MSALLPGPLVAISDRRRLDDPWPRWLDALASAGISAVQIREKDIPDAGLYHLVRSGSVIGSPSS